MSAGALKDRYGSQERAKIWLIRDKSREKGLVTVAKGPLASTIPCVIQDSFWGGQEYYGFLFSRWGSPVSKFFCKLARPFWSHDCEFIEDPLGTLSQALIRMPSPTLHIEYRELLLPFQSPLLSCLLPFAQWPGLGFINSLVILALINLYQELAASLCPGTRTRSGPRLSTGLWEHLLPPVDIFSLFSLVTRFPLQMDSDLFFSGSAGSLTICVAQ